MRVLIENYNLEKKEYSQFCSEIAYLSLEQIIELLKEIPPKKIIKRSFRDKILILLKNTEFLRSFRNKQVRIVTENYVIVKKDQNSVLIERNHKAYDKSSVVNIEDIGSFIEAKFKKFEKYKKFGDTIIFALGLFFIFGLISTLPIFNLITISVNYSALVQDLTKFILFAILFGLSFISIGFDVKDLVFGILNPKKKSLKLSIPYLDTVGKKDISKIVAHFVQGLYLVIFDYFNIVTFEEFYNILFINGPSELSIIYGFILAMIIINLTFTPILFIYRLIVESWKKNKVLDILRTKFHPAEKFDRIYYLNLYSEIKNLRVVKFGILSKLTGYISIIGILYQIIFLI